MRSKKKKDFQIEMIDDDSLSGQAVDIEDMDDDDDESVDKAAFSPDQDDSAELDGDEETESEEGAAQYGLKPSEARENANEYDLIRFYLHEIADHSLLTREEEIKIAKEIETGKRVIARAILNSTLMMREIIRLGEDLQKGSLSIRDITSSLDDSEGSDNAEEDVQLGIRNSLNAIVGLYADNEQARAQLEKATQKNRKQLQDKIRKNNNRMLIYLEDINLKGTQMEKMLSVARTYIERVEKLQRERDSLEKQKGAAATKARKALKGRLEDFLKMSETDTATLRKSLKRIERGEEMTHRAHASRGKIRIQQGIQILDLRHVVDKAGHNEGARRPVEDNPNPRSHDRDH